MSMKMTMIGAAAAAFAFAAPVFADPPADVMKITQEPEIKFVPSRVTPGISQAVLLGESSVPGQVYVVRNKFSPGTFSAPRSEERRVGKECRGRWWSHHAK